MENDWKDDPFLLGLAFIAVIGGIGIGCFIIHLIFVWQFNTAMDYFSGIEVICDIAWFGFAWCTLEKIERSKKRR